MKRFPGLAPASCLVLFLEFTGCASIVDGTRQDMTVTSVPSSASVFVDSRYAGVTPLVTRLSRRAPHTVRVQAPTLEAQDSVVERRMNAWFWGNFLLSLPGVAFGMPIDALTGAMWKLVPNRIDVIFPGSSASPGAAGFRIEGEGPTLAVAEFEAQGVSASDAAVICDLFRSEMVQAGRFSVVEKANMEKILNEQAFQQTGCTTQECAVKLGKILNVRYLAVGSFGKLLDQYVLSVRVVDVETARVAHSDSEQGRDVEEIRKGISSIARRLSTGSGSGGN